MLSCFQIRQTKLSKAKAVEREREGKLSIGWTRVRTRRKNERVMDGKVMS